MALETPILFLVFNRPDTTYRVLQAIKAARPSKLYIAADGPRIGNDNDVKKCKEVRDLIQYEVDWECELKTLFRTNNLGCKDAVRSAIDWFFAHVEEGIILEDDCLPTPAFFDFCSQGLEYFRFHNNVKIISGTNYFFGKYHKYPNTFFSPFMPIWGWATWKRVWEEISFDMSLYPKWKRSGKITDIYSNSAFAQWINGILEQAYQGEISTWDAYKAFHFLLKGGVALRYSANLVSNIGYNGEHTNGVSKKHPSFDMPFILELSSTLDFELTKVNKKLLDEEMENVIKIVNEPSKDQVVEPRLLTFFNYSKRLVPPIVRQFFKNV